MQDTAAVIHWGSRIWASSLFVKLLFWVDAGIIEPVSNVVCCTYDETPLPLRPTMVDEAG